MEPKVIQVEPHLSFFDSLIFSPGFIVWIIGLIVILLGLAFYFSVAIAWRKSLPWYVAGQALLEIFILSSLNNSLISKCARLSINKNGAGKMFCAPDREYYLAIGGTLLVLIGLPLLLIFLCFAKNPSEGD